jgi:hypothetical protein
MWNWLKKVGKVALMAAPYVAAPFTGGASLMLAPAANALDKKWMQHDANANIAKGIAPSSFDKYLGMAGDIASIASPTGALGALGKVGSVAGGLGKAATIANAGLGTMGAIGNVVKQGQQPQQQPSGGYQMPSYNPIPMNQGMNQGIGPSQGMMQSQLSQSPSIDEILNRGRQDAMRGLYNPSMQGYGRG